MTIQGAPDVLLGRCTQYIGSEGERHEFEIEMQTVVEDIKNEWSATGKRIIVLAHKVVQGQDVDSYPSSSQFEDDVLEHLRSGLTLVGLVGVVNPRDEIPKVVRMLRRVGIRIFIIYLMSYFPLNVIPCFVLTNV